MAFLLLTVIYIAFIGLGVPDSLFGAAWPAIYGEFGLPFSYGSFITTIVYCGTTVSSLFSARLIKRFGTYKITAFSTALTALALLAFSFSGHVVFFCLCAIPLGLGAGCIDTALNNYAAQHYSSTQMNFLHCFYGIGISISPYILSRVISSELGWRGGYRIAFLIQITLALIVFLSYPLWKRAPKKADAVADENIRVMSFKEVIRTPGVKPICAALFSIGAIEIICNAWGSTFLVENKALAPDIAAGLVLFYFVGMAFGRLLAGIVASKLNSWKIIFYRAGYIRGRAGGAATGRQPACFDYRTVFDRSGQRAAVSQCKLLNP